MPTIKDLLRPVRNRASEALYGDATTYTLRLRGTRTRFSTETPAAHRWFFPRYAFNRLHEKPATLRLVDDFVSARCFADVGANLGYYTCLATRFMDGGEVHAFEMDVDNFAMLETNIGLNPSDTRVTATHAAVSKEPGSVTYKRRPDGNHPALSIYNPWPEQGEVEVTVPALTLDGYFAEHGTSPDIVKIDVEGAEVDVLLGMTGLLPEVRRLYLEVHPENLALAGQSPADALELLAPHFRLYLMPGHRTQRDSELTVLSPSSLITSNAMVLATK